MGAKLTNKLYIEICLSKNIIPLEKYKGVDVKQDVKCKTCGHKWSVKFNNIKKKTTPTGCPPCGEKKRAKSKTRDLSQIKTKLKQYGVKFLENEYRGYKVKHLLSCMACDFQWENSMDKIVNGRKCPKCVSELKNLNKPTTVYAAIIVHNQTSFIKIGLTTQAIKQRMAEIKSNLGTKFIQPIAQIKISTLIEAKRVEKLILEKLGPFKYSHTTTFNGYHECLNIESTHKVLELMDELRENS